MIEENFIFKIDYDVVIVGVGLVGLVIVFGLY